MQEKADYNLLESFLKMTWILPENCTWDTIAAQKISQHILDTGSLLEIGIGNGFFSFRMLGGVFQEDFDWYLKIADKSFWDNEDVYNIKFDAAHKYLKKPRRKIQLAIDHKSSLLETAKSLDFIENTLVNDANH